MANSAPRPKRIFNLLKPYTAPPTVWDKAYDWLVTRARIILIVVEIIVAVSFVSKVVVDVQAKALDEKLVSSNFELGSYAATVEPHLRSVQQKVNSYTKIWQGSSSFAPILSEIDSYIPTNAADIQILINSKQVSVSGKEDLDTLSKIEQQMKISPTFTSTKISLDTTTDANTGEQNSQYVLTADLAEVSSRVITK